MSQKLEDKLNPELVLMAEQCNKVVKDEISRISLRDLSSGKKIMSMLLKQKGADKIRSKNEKRGINYPVAVVVDRQNSSINSNMDLWGNVFNQCKASGVSVVALADDSIMIQKSTPELLAKYPEIIFPVMIKSTELNADLVSYFYNTRNVIPIIKIDKFDKGIDLSALKKHNILFVLYIKVNSENLQSVLNNKMIEYYINNGCKAFCYMEDKNKITSDEIGILEQTMNFFKDKYKGIFVSFPGGLEKYRGCLEEGVGFCYISPKCEIMDDEPLDNTNIISGLLNAKLKDVRDLQGIF